MVLVLRLRLHQVDVLSYRFGNQLCPEHIGRVQGAEQFNVPGGGNGFADGDNRQIDFARELTIGGIDPVL